MHLTSKHAAPWKVVGQKWGPTFPVMRKSGMNCTGSVCLHKWSKNGGKNRVARALKAKLIMRQNCSLLRIMFGAKLT